MIKMVRAFGKRLAESFLAPPLPTQIPNREVEAARAVNLASLIEHLGYKPRWYSSEKAMFKSPLREEENPSFSVSFYKGRWVWKDWGTGETGDSISFVMAYYGLSFPEAVRKLTGGSITPPPRSASVKYDADKIDFVRRLYADRMKLMSEKEARLIRGYFSERGVKYPPEMGAVIYRSFREKKTYLGIPIPHAGCIKGLECRELGGDSRKTIGHKTLWYLHRNSPTILVTESIMDCLAGEIVLGRQSAPPPSLLSLNGVGNVSRLAGVMEKLRPQRVLLALDSDLPGREAQEVAKKTIKPLCGEVVEINHHIRKGCKDLHRLLLLMQGQKAVPTPTQGRP